MARRMLSDRRFDFRAGVNTAYSVEVLSKDELRKAQNGRPNEYGGVAQRGGSQRINATALASGADVEGVVQWDAPSEREIVAIAGGNLYHKGAGDTAFTEVASTIAAGFFPSFAVFDNLGGSKKLYFTDGSALWSWDGSSLVDQTATNGAPSGAEDLAVYKGRLFATDGTPTIHYSAIGDAEDWSAGGGAGEVEVETMDREPLVGLQVVGSSLLMAKGDSIARFTGVDAQDIQIDKQTEGVSPTVGCAARRTFIGVDEFAVMLSTKGVYLVAEGGVKPVGVKIEDQIRDAGDLTDAVAGHHRGRNEIWVYLPGADEVWVYAMRLDSWWGPWTVTAKSLARYERSDGTETVMRGDGAGWVLEHETGTQDDVNSDGSGGANIIFDVELPPILGESPGEVKRIGRISNVEADLGTTGLLEIYWSSEQGSDDLAISSEGEGGLKSWRFQLGARGRRITVGVRDRSSSAPKLNGVELFGTSGGF